jgi:hypothetical protein
MLHFSVVNASWRKLLSLVHRQTERSRTAVIALSETTWDLQRATWMFASVHINSKDSDSSQIVTETERRVVDKLDRAYRAFTCDYDWPADLASVVKKEVKNIGREMLNLKAYSMTGQKHDLEDAAQKIQTACERIRDLAKPYAYRSLTLGEEIILATVVLTALGVAGTWLTVPEFRHFVRLDKPSTFSTSRAVTPPRQDEGISSKEEHNREVTSGPAKTTGSCSPAITGNENTVICDEVPKSQQKKKSSN